MRYQCKVVFAKLIFKKLVFRNLTKRIPLYRVFSLSFKIQGSLAVTIPYFEQANSPLLLIQQKTSISTRSSVYLRVVVTCSISVRGGGESGWKTEREFESSHHGPLGCATM
jgi:hypothetical protein